MRTTSKTFHNGSSPLTRGTPVQTASIRGLLRFIPAYAGNSSIVPCASKYGPVHPRLRGELFFRNDRDRVACGSSPLTRGTQKDIVNRLRRHRFIPAYAGNSLKQGIEHLTNSSKDFLSGKYAKNPETVLNHFKNSSLD